MNSWNNSRYEFGPFVLDPKERLLLRDGQALTLTPKAFDTLRLLVANSGHVLTKEEMLTELWADTFVEEANLTNNISILRRALGDDSESQQFIKTVPRVGYRFVAPVKAVYDAPPMRVSPVSSAESAAATVHYPSSAEYIVTEIKQHKRAAVGTLALILTVSAVAAFFYFNRTKALTEKDTILLADIVNTTGDPVFDATLKLGLAVQLGQSPFFNIFPEERVRETLRYMGRSPDERVTKEVGRQICQREGIKALLTGSIASLGRHYVITLETLDGQTGDALAREQVEAESKEQVIRRLGEAATKLREKLGESLASIRRFDTPLEQATTSSLEALRAYTWASEQSDKGKSAEAIPFLKRAVELDPNFATAYAFLAVMYSNVHDPSGVAEQYAAKAFELRERVTESEKFYISSVYYWLVTKDLDKQIEVLELWRQTYPRLHHIRNDLTVEYARVGQYEKAIEEGGEGLRLNPNGAFQYGNLGWAYRALGRYDEAKATIEQARARNLDTWVVHLNAYLIAFAEGDQAEMRRQLEWASGKPSEFTFLDSQSWTEMFSGRYRQSRETARRAAESAQSQDLKTGAARNISTSAVWDALVGNCQRARAETAKALAIARGAEPPVTTALASALCGDVARAQSIIDDLARRNPTSTEINAIWLPVIRAAIEIGRGNQAEAIRLLQKAKRYEMGLAAEFWPTYMRGQAYLRQGSATEAIAEFQKIIDRRSVSPAHILYPLAYLGLARAAASAGDTDRSRKAYEDFFALWKDADPDIPILQQAKQEYDKLK
jgi:DNA-binding winged helix-turn-helix (wHTH) protein/tetratricopeptide (TPR) repeat protein